MTESKQVKINWLPSSGNLKKIMRKYAMKAKVAAALPWKKTAWATAGMPIELLYACGIYPLHPENSACVAGVKKTSLEMIEYAESLGYSRDLCSYFKTNVGSWDKKIKTSLGGVEKPSFCCSTNTICDTHVKWFQIQARKIGVPYFAFDIPSFVSGSDDVRLEGYIDYVSEQVYDFFEFVEKNTGKKFNEKKFFDILEKSERLAELWHEIYEYRKLIPTQYSFQDSLAAIFPMVIMPGLQDGIDYYENLIRDIKERIKEGKAAMPRGTEKYRVLWEGIPMWYRIKYLHELTNLGVVITYEPYTYSFGPRKKLGLSFEDTIRDLSKMIINNPYNYNLERRIEYFKDVIEKYSLNGVILHANMSCRPSCTGMIDLKNAIQQECSIPVLMIDCDMTDPRAYAEGAMRTRMESFVELMEAKI